MALQSSARRSLATARSAVAVLLFALAACGSDAADTQATTEVQATDASTSAAVADAAAANESDPADSQAAGAEPGSSAVSRADVVSGYAALVEASYAKSLASVEALRTSITAFLDSPSEEGLSAAKAQWLSARNDYGPTEAFRFYDGPIDNPETGPEGRINAWPMDEAYVDGVVDAPTSGIINDVSAYPEITAEVLVDANESGGETNISTGWHAIEFLLWGQDTSSTGPGARPFADYTTAPNADRRATYLRLLADQLVADLTLVHGAWKSDGAYRATFVADPEASLAKILRGIGALSSGELAGERMAVPVETKDQEDEHSCFSDNTNADVVGNATGARGVYFGELAGAKAPVSLSSLVASVNPDLDSKLRKELDRSVALATAYPAPFDQMITGDDDSPGRVALLETITALETQGDSIAEVAGALGLKVNLEV